MIMAGGKGERLHPLTRDRSKPAVPFGGRYRIVDFVLSNFVNSEMAALYVLVQYKSQSLIEHLRQGDGGHPELKRVLAQGSRELLLLEASDWQFLITTGAARDYAERRVAEHYAEFKRLSELAGSLGEGHPLTIEAAETLRRLEREDFVFPDLDPTWGQPPACKG